MTPLWLSLEVACIALFNIMVVGLLLCYILKRYSFPGKALIDSIVTLPLVLPPVVVGFYVTCYILHRAIVLGHGLMLTVGRLFLLKQGAVLASSIIGFPLFYQTVRSALGSIDPAVEDVARTLGASELRIFFTISIPLAWKGILTGSILAFSRALGEFGATILIAGNIPGVTRTMPLAIYSLVEFGDYEEAFSLVLYICALTLGLLWTVHFITKGSLFQHREER